MNATCPYCGFNLEADAPFETGDWRIVPREGVFWRGQLIVRRATWTNFLMTLAREHGRILSSEVVLARVSDGESNNVIASQASQLRRALEKAGAPVPFSSSRGRGACGYYWSEAA